MCFNCFLLCGCHINCHGNHCMLIYALYHCHSALQQIFFARLACACSTYTHSFFFVKKILNFGVILSNKNMHLKTLILCWDMTFSVKTWLYFWTNHSKVKQKSYMVSPGNLRKMVLETNRFAGPLVRKAMYLLSCRSPHSRCTRDSTCTCRTNQTDCWSHCLKTAPWS